MTKNLDAIEKPKRVKDKVTNRLLLYKELTIEEYVCTKGWDCKTALAVAKAESGMRCDAQNVNTNGSVDLGLFMINSVHLKKGWQAKDLLDCKKNTDYAYEIYQRQGWQPWVVFQTGAFKKFL